MTFFFSFATFFFQINENYPPMLGMDQVVSLSEEYYAFSFIFPYGGVRLYYYLELDVGATNQSKSNKHFPSFIHVTTLIIPNNGSVL